MGIENPKPTPDITIYKSVDETVNNSNVAQSDDEIAGVVLSAGHYWWRSLLVYESEANADIWFNVLFSGAVTAIGWSYNVNTSLTGTSASQAINNNTTFVSAIQCGGNGAGVHFLSVWECYLEVPAACTVTLRWAQQVAQLSDTKVLAGSKWEFTKIE